MKGGKMPNRRAGQRSLGAQSVQPKKGRRPALVAVSDTLPIVEGSLGRALQLRARLAMSRESFARLVPMSTRSLASVESGKAPSPPVLRQLKELRRVIDALGEVIQQDAIGPWLEQPNEAFGGLKPREVIERGEVDRIWQMLFYLRSGIAS
jgi:transcriptional regulator with XRE-family HTH domain